jgi:RimJ/RimL family protein N-acetyltransferase
VPDPDPRRPRLADLTWPRRTARTTLRPLTLDDVDAVLAYRGDPDVNRWLGRPARTREELVDSHFAADDLLDALAVEVDGRVVGDTMVTVGDAWGQKDVREQARRTVAVLAWALAPSHHGRGLMTEAVEELLRISFEELGVRRVVAECFATNEPSWRLMERVGMRREAHTRQDALHRDLGWVDGLAYAILADEWRSRHA